MHTGNLRTYIYLHMYKYWWYDTWTTVGRYPLHYLLYTVHGCSQSVLFPTFPLSFTYVRRYIRTRLLRFLEPLIVVTMTVTVSFMTVFLSPECQPIGTEEAYQDTYGGTVKVGGVCVCVCVCVRACVRACVCTYIGMYVHMCTIIQPNCFTTSPLVPHFPAIITRLLLTNMM